MTLRKLLVELAKLPPEAQDYPVWVQGGDLSDELIDVGTWDASEHYNKYIRGDGDEERAPEIRIALSA